jgi:hypothetical protein
MTSKIYELKQRIEQGKIPTNHKHFENYGLTITDDPSKTCDEYDLLILTCHASAWSWLVESLQSAFAEKLRRRSFYDFHRKIAEDIMSSFNTDGDLFDAMLLVIANLEARYFQCVPTYIELNNPPF